MPNEKLIAYTVVARDELPSFWVRIGEAMTFGGAIEIMLDALPLNGRIQLRSALGSPARLDALAEAVEPVPVDDEMDGERVRRRISEALGGEPGVAQTTDRLLEQIGQHVRSARGRARVVAPERVASILAIVGSIRACLDDTEVGSTEAREHSRVMLRSTIAHLESTLASTFPDGGGKPAAVGLPRPKIRAKLSATLASFFLRQLEELGPEKLRQMHRGDFALMIERILVEHGRG